MTGPTLVNDVHSGLNPTRVSRVLRPATIEQLQTAVRESRDSGASVAVCAARHAMGGQQFLTDHALLDTSALNRVISMDHDRGLLTVEAGATWPTVIAASHSMQRAAHPGRPPRWGIAQKQTGAGGLTIGGAVSANAHGRGLTMKPIVGDIDSLTLVGPEAQLVECSRDVNPDLFRLVVGGYGLFGAIATVTLRLAPRRRLRRVVRVIDIDDAVSAVRRRIADGFLYGDFQFDVDPASPEFLTKGVFSCYQPLDGDEPEPSSPKELSRDDWMKLLLLAHTDKARAFSLYAQHYVGTDGQTYWSDTHQLGVYLDGYHSEIDRAVASPCACSEMITELYVPHDRLIDFLHAAARTLTARSAEVIYGTIRLIRRDDESFLPWAKEDAACVIFNLHVRHSPEGVEHAAGSFRALIDLALERAGRFFLTYHRFATREQLLAGYPELPDFLRRKAAHDPDEVFTSDWHQWLKRTLHA